ncbi:MAG: hypothetical protein IKZ59_06770 [Clostridia bacterium]|nr:hypothetical protein [Clostridia bacterium]
MKEDQKIITGKFMNHHPLSAIIAVIGIIFVIAVLIIVVSPIGSLMRIRYRLLMVMVSVTAFVIPIVLLNWLIKRTTLDVTYKRVTVKNPLSCNTLPLDKISLVNKGLFKTIKVGTSSARTCVFGCINNNEIYETLLSLTAARQSLDGAQEMIIPAAMSENECEQSEK